MALSKPSSHIPLLTSDGISVNGRTSSSNINGAYNQILFHFSPLFCPCTIRLHFKTTLPTTLAAVLIIVISVGFDDGYKTQITYAKPILDEYGFKASFFVVCNYADSGNVRRMITDLRYYY